MCLQASKESVQYSLTVQLTSYEIEKLRRFADCSIDEKSLTLLQDITDVLKTMIIGVKEQFPKSYLNEFRTLDDEQIFAVKISFELPFLSFGLNICLIVLLSILRGQQYLFVSYCALDFLGKS